MVAALSEASASLAVVKAIRTRLVASDVLAAESILDRNARPNPDPAIVLGEGQVVDEGDIARSAQRVFATIHVWKREPSLGGVQAIAGAIRSAIHQGRAALDGFHLAGWYVSDTRFLRDPDGATSHAVVTVEALVQQT